jgi:very-short-patch-repair endonuclease
VGLVGTESILLDRHQHLRSQGLPVVTVLAGPPGLGGRVWRRWAADGGRPVIAPAAATPADVATAWAALGAVGGELRSRAIAWLARTAHLPADDLPARLAAMTPHDFAHWWAGLPVAVDPSPAAAACRLLLDPATPAADRPPAAGVAGVYGPAGIPAVLLTPPAGAGPDWLSTALGMALGLAVQAPAVPVGLAVPAEAVESFLAVAGDTRAAAAVREGLVRVRGQTADDLSVATGGRAVPTAVLGHLADLGASDELAAALVAAANAPEVPPDPAAEEAARSAAEQFLWQVLEHDPATAGLFVLNEELPFKHGPRPAEADLVSEKLMLVIELDGAYFHLADRACYRRDRRKDWEYQRHGYLVLRFLSEDVVPRLEEVLDRIAAAVASRRSAPHGDAT